MKYSNVSTYFFGALLICWMGVIFGFSSLHGTSFATDPPLWYIIERKGAHVFEYAVLMFLAFCFFYRIFSSESFWKNLSFSMVFSLAYGVTDELHQFFVPFRGAKMTDVFVDGLGIFLMSLFFILLRKQMFAQKKKQNRS